MTYQDDRAIAGALARARDAGRPCALATIVATRGSTPRKVGARLVVDPAEGLTGTVGGGCGEAEVIVAAERVLETGRPERIVVDLTEDMLSWSPAVCGGTMDVFIERVPGEQEAVLPEGVPPGVEEAAPPDGGSSRVRIHYRRPPDQVHVFEHRRVHSAPDVEVTLADGIPLTQPMRIGGEVVLEDGSEVVWFTFPGEWHDLGRFHLADGSFTGIYANVLTPVHMDGREWHTTDLYLDVWIPADGEPVLLDEHELDAAVGRELVDVEAADRARHEGYRLLRAARDGSWPPDVVREWTLERCRRALSGDG